jgi:glycosyltransferase involved in cell wall biosynthesis
VVFDQWLGLMLLRVRGGHVVLALQNAPLVTARYRRLWRWVIDPVVDTYVCASVACQRPLVAFGVAPEKIRVVYNAPPPRPGTTTTRPSRQRGRVIYVGQIIPAKGLDLLLDAVGILVDRGLDVSLDIVGRHDGWIAPEYERFRNDLFERASRPDLIERVRFLGFREDVPALMAAATVHCIPSRPEMCEGFGIVVAEAKEAGVPSVAFDHGPFPELIDHRRTGWLCSEHTPAALAEGLQFFLTSADRDGRVAAEVRASGSRFTMGAFARGWREVFELGKNAAREPV